MNFVPTGIGSVCFRAAEGKAFSDIESDVRELLGRARGTASVEVTKDSYGYTWLTCQHSKDDFEALVTDLHAVNSSLADGGFGPQLLCTLVSFADDKGRKLGIVYLYKRGTFYPFAPTSGEQRDNALELQVRGAGRRRPEDRARPEPLVRGLGRPRPVTAGPYRIQKIRRADRNTAKSPCWQGGPL